MGSNQCAACGQWSGRGHRCPPPSAVSTLPASISTPATHRGSDATVAAVPSRVSRAQDYLAHTTQTPAQQEAEYENEVATEAYFESMPLDRDEQAAMDALDSIVSRRSRGPRNPPPNGVVETQRSRRGHAFYPPSSARIPKLYATETIRAADKTIKAHYFSSNSDFYIAEYDSWTGRAFGYSVINGHRDDAEWGYIHLPDLERAGGGLNIVERDLHWDATKFSDIPEVQRKPWA